MQPSGNIFLHTWKHTHETYQILKITQKYTFTYSDTAANMSFVRDTFNAVLDVPHYSKTVLFYFMALSTPRGAVLPCVITEVKNTSCAMQLPALPCSVRSCPLVGCSTLPGPLNSHTYHVSYELLIPAQGHVSGAIDLPPQRKNIQTTNRSYVRGLHDLFEE